MHCIIVGASRGLGAAIVEECLKDDNFFVIGIGRSEREKINDYEKWINSGRFKYYQLDVTNLGDKKTLSLICDSLPNERVCIIFNAAIMESDIEEKGDFIYDVYNRVSQVCIIGLGFIIDAFDKHLRKHKGILVGISSLSAWVPPFLDKRIAYPASKAFLTMAFRSLRIVWEDQVDIMTVFLGHIGNTRFKNAPQWFIPSYEIVARKIVWGITRKRIPSTMLIPLPVCTAYKILKILPDSFGKWSFKRAQWLLRLILGNSNS